MYIWSTTQPTLSVSTFRAAPGGGGGLFRSSLISIAWRRASCLLRSTGSVYSLLPSGLSFRSWTLRASWNLTPLRAKICSSSVSWIRGSTFSIKVLTPTPDGVQRYPSANLAGSCRLPKAFCRRQARVSALLKTHPESLAGSPGLFEPPSDEVVGQTPSRLPNSPGPSTWEVGVEVDIFFETGTYVNAFSPFPESARPEYFLRLSGRAQAFAFQQEADQCIRPCRPCFIS